MQLCVYRRVAVSRIAGGRGAARATDKPIASVSVDHTGASLHLADDVVHGVGNVEVALLIERHSLWIVEFCACCRPVVSAEAPLAVSGDRCHGSGACENFLDEAGPGVGDIQVAGGIEGNACGVVQVPDGPVADKCSNDSRLNRNLANCAVSGVGYIEIACRVQRHTLGIVEFRTRCRAAIARVARGSVAGHGGDDPCARGDLTNPVVAGVGNIEIANGVQRRRRTEVQIGSGC